MLKKFLRGASLTEFLTSRIVGNTGIMTVGIGMQLVLQMISFVLVTRTMGASAFGAFSSVVALAGIAAAFAGWGGDQMLIRTVARAPDEFPRALGSALAFFFISAPFLIVVAVFLVPLLVHRSVPWQVIFLIALSDILFARANGIAINCYQAFERGRDMARLGVILSGLRAAAAVLWTFASPHADPLSWAWFYLGSALIAGSFSFYQVFRDLGRPLWTVRWRDWRDGGFFALQMASFMGFRDIDKPVVVALSTLSEAGLYAAAFRIADVAAVPVRAMMYSTYVRFFQHGAQGTRGSLAFARRLIPAGFALGIVAGIGVGIGSLLAPWILGPNYAGMPVVLLLLAPLPMLYAFYYIGADALISGGHGGFRTLFQLVLPLLDVALCIILVPRYGANGAAIAAVLTHVVLVIAVWTAAVIIVKRGGPAPLTPA